MIHAIAKLYKIVVKFYMIVIDFYDIIVKLGFAWFGGKQLMDTWFCEIIENLTSIRLTWLWTINLKLI